MQGEGGGGDKTEGRGGGLLAWVERGCVCGTRWERGEGVVQRVLLPEGWLLKGVVWLFPTSLNPGPGHSIGKCIGRAEKATLLQGLQMVVSVFKLWDYPKAGHQTGHLY